MGSKSLERLLERHRPPREQEDEPCSTPQLYHLNRHGLLEQAIAAQRAKQPGKRRVFVTRLTAWEVLAEAQRNGLKLLPLKTD